MYNVFVSDTTAASDHPRLPTHPQVEARVVELETRLAFQEHTLQALNDVVARQQQQIEVLVREIQTLKDRLRATVPSPVGPLEDEKPPPHY